MEAVYGRDISEMLGTLSYQGLVNEVDAIMDVNPNDTHLRLHLKDNPDDGMTAIAYDKGYFFLRLLEETVGRPAFDDLKTYFTSHAFQVMDTDSFLSSTPTCSPDALRDAVNVPAWVDGQGLPDNCPEVQSARLDLVDATLDAWVRGDKAASDLPWDQWLYQEKYRFLSNLPDDISSDRLAELDAAWSVNATGNNEVLFAWLEQAVAVTILRRTGAWKRS